MKSWYYFIIIWTWSSDRRQVNQHWNNTFWATGNSVLSWALNIPCFIRWVMGILSPGWHARNVLRFVVQIMIKSIFYENISFTLWWDTLLDLLPISYDRSTHYLTLRGTSKNLIVVQFFVAQPADKTMWSSVVEGSNYFKFTSVKITCRMNRLN